MYNWNTNTSKWNKRSDSYQIWKLEQLINFGLNGERLNLASIRKYWSKLNLDSHRKKFLELILWPRRDYS